MSKKEYPITAAVRFLRTKGVHFVPHVYPYEDHGGTRHAADFLHVPEHAVIKTLVMDKDSREQLVILMHGDREVSTKQLARLLEAKRVTPCDMKTAQKITGYLVGGISPFGMRMSLPVYAESTIFKLEKIYINGGKRGFLVEISPEDLREALSITEVQVAIEHV